MRMRLALIALAATVLSFAADAYTGKWSSDNTGSSGTIRIVLAEDKPQVTFTVSGQEVATTPASAKLEGGSVRIAYDFDLQGYKLRSELTGTLQEGRIAGKYTTTLLGDGSAVDSGTFEVSAK